MFVNSIENFLWMPIGEDQVVPARSAGFIPGDHDVFAARQRFSDDVEGFGSHDDRPGPAGDANEQPLVFLAGPIGEMVRALGDFAVKGYGHQHDAFHMAPRIEF